MRAKELSYAQSDVTRFRVAGGALAIESLDWRGPGSKVVGSGNVGLLEGIDTHLRLDVDTDLGIVGALLSGRATGRLNGNLELHRRSGVLRVTSEATLSEASWLIPAQRILFAGWSGHLRLADQALSVTKLGGTVNGGTIRIDGRLPLEAGAGGDDLTIAARDILIDVPRGLRDRTILEVSRGIRASRRSASSICCSTPAARTRSVDTLRTRCRPSTSPASRSAAPTCSS